MMLLSFSLGTTITAMNTVSCGHSKKQKGWSSFKEFLNFVEETSAEKMWDNITDGILQNKLSNINIVAPSAAIIKNSSPRYIDDNKSLISLDVKINSAQTSTHPKNINTQGHIYFNIKYDKNVLYNINNWSLDYDYNNWSSDAALTYRNNQDLILLTPLHGKPYTNVGSGLLDPTNKTITFKSEAVGSGADKTHFKKTTLTMPKPNKANKVALFGNGGTTNLFTWTNDDQGDKSFTNWIKDLQKSLITKNSDPTKNDNPIMANLIPVLKLLKVKYPDQFPTTWNLKDPNFKLYYTSNSIPNTGNYYFSLDLAETAKSTGASWTITANFHEGWSQFQASNFNGFKKNPSK